MIDKKPRVVEVINTLGFLSSCTEISDLTGHDKTRPDRT